MSERLACKAVGLARSTYRRTPVAATPADPDADLRAWLRTYSTGHPCHGFRRAWAALRHDEHRGVNKKKVHRLWKEEGLQRRVHSPRKRAGAVIVPTGGGRRCAEGGVGAGFSVRLHHRRQGDQDRVDGRRAHPRVAAGSGGTLDHRRAARRRAREGVRRGRRAAKGAADGQWARS